ncbi:hypothetical protein FQA39_LY11203 [Lamprigera yunnana]|nr:hypothetical protein FQA39_LY11203 [Lamprigera yunnana]
MVEELTRCDQLRPGPQFGDSFFLSPENGKRNGTRPLRLFVRSIEQSYCDVGDNAIPDFRFYRSAQPRFPLEALSEAASALNADNSDIEDDVAETTSADIGDCDCDLWVPEDEEEDEENEEEDEENVENKISDSEIEASGNSRRTNKAISNLKCKKVGNNTSLSDYKGIGSTNTLGVNKGFLDNMIKEYANDSDALMGTYSKAKSAVGPAPYEAELLGSCISSFLARRKPLHQDDDDDDESDEDVTQPGEKRRIQP